MNNFNRCLAGAFLWSCTHIAQADTVLGVYAGAGIWQADFSGKVGVSSASIEGLGFDDEDSNMFYVALEHPVPLIPNIRLQYTDISSSSSATLSSNVVIDQVSFTTGSSVATELELSHTDAILYYEILDNWVNLDLGINVRRYDGSLEIRSGSLREDVSLDGVIPMLYGKAQIDMPFTGWSAGLDASVVSYSGDSITDYAAKILYTSDALPLLDLGFELGYREMSLELDDLDDLETDLTLDGPYAGVTFHF